MSNAEQDNLFHLGEQLFHRQPDVRIRAALDLGEHPQGYTELKSLMNALDDRDRAVREVLFDTLDRIVAAHPETFDELVDRAGDEGRPPMPGLARYLVHVGTPEAIEGALATNVGDAAADERADLLEMLVDAKELTNERLEAMVDAGGEDEMRRIACEVLGQRGVAKGWQALFGGFGSKRFFNEFIARGPNAIRILACAFPSCDESWGQIAERLAAHRATTEGIVDELVSDPSSPGFRTAVEVLGYWDEPRNVEILMHIAQDASRPRDSWVREEAIESLCRLEAPEAMDVLIRTLLDREYVDWIRWDCAMTLGEIGKLEALEALESVAEGDPDESLRGYAKEAIGVIQEIFAPGP
ncbi:MAG TPA: HEAT repeat domain-containing protein [Polyangiaceae bacterium]